MDEPTYGKKVIDNAKFYTLSAAVYSVLDDIQAGEERFSQFLKYAIDAAREFTFDALHEIHFAVIPMLQWKQIAFPSNMVDWTVIGVRSNGQMKVFTRDSGIGHFNEDEVFEDISTVPAVGSIPIVGQDNYFHDGAGLYGSRISANQSGYFNVDWKNRVFNFHNTVNNVGNVYLEYITDGINYCGQTVIHPYAFRAIQLYIHWQRKENDDKYSESASARAKHLFEQEYTKVIVRNLNLSIADIKEALRSQYRQTVKN
ncbi:MAG: hypothetical protein WKF87_06745 [Chryseolinea sp.]